MGKIFGINDILNAVFNKDSKSIKVDADLQVDSVSVSDVSIKGSIVEYAWLTGAEKPTPTEAFAWGNELDANTGVLKVYSWTGIAWVEVV